MKCLFKNPKGRGLVRGEHRCGSDRSCVSQTVDLIAVLKVGSNSKLLCRKRCKGCVSDGVICKSCEGSLPSCVQDGCKRLIESLIHSYRDPIFCQAAKLAVARGRRCAWGWLGARSIDRSIHTQVTYWVTCIQYRGSAVLL